jgi:hypothetical protein
MVNNVHIIIVIVTIAVLWTQVLFPTNAFAQSSSVLQEGNKNVSLAPPAQNDSLIETAKMNISLEARQINGNIYLVLGDFTDTTKTIDYTQAICSTGDVVVEGGYQNPNAIFSSNDIVIASGPFFNSITQGYGYQVTIATKTGTIGSYQAYAYCYDNTT